jgi:hypothetical protein
MGVSILPALHSATLCVPQQDSSYPPKGCGIEQHTHVFQFFVFFFVSCKPRWFLLQIQIWCCKADCTAVIAQHTLKLHVTAFS